jgi:ribosomal protein L11 methyltransferase
MRLLSLTTSPEDADLAADAVWQLGVRGLEERLHADGSVELRADVGQHDDALAAALRRLSRWNAVVVDVDDAPRTTWRDEAVARAVGDRLLVVPAWTAPTGETDGGRVVIRIETGGAFGLGDHPTTSLCLTAVDEVLSAADGDSGPPWAMLDVGSGTGVLSIAAAALTGRWRRATRIRAIDHSDAAVEQATANAVANGVHDRITVDGTLAPDLRGEFDLVVANLLAPILIALAADLTRLTAPAGRLVVSGILAASHAHVLDAFGAMDVERTDVDGEWAAVWLRHRVPSSSSMS